jgi:hypothetical protein
MTGIATPRGASPADTAHSPAATSRTRRRAGQSRRGRDARVDPPSYNLTAITLVTAILALVTGRRRA